MHARGKLALAIVTGGIALGVVLGAAVNPEMKHAPEPPPQAALRDSAADTSYQLAETVPAGTSLGWAHDSYAPAWASEEVTNWEPRYPAWTYSDFADEAVEPPSAAQPAPPAPASAEAAASDALTPEPRGEGALGPLY